MYYHDNHFNFACVSNVNTAKYMMDCKAKYRNGEDLILLDCHNRTIAYREWFGYAPDEDQENLDILSFPEHEGFYGPWVDVK